MTTAVEALARPIADPITGGSVAPDFELEAITREVDVDKFVLDLVKFRKYSVDIRAVVTAADIELSLDGAHSLTVTLRDVDRTLQSSGALDYALDMEVEGWGWRLVKRSKSGDDLTLTFEPRVVAWLRSKKQRRKARRGKVTRAEFVLLLIHSVRRRKLKLYSPELHKDQPIAKATQQDERSRVSNRQPGLDNDYHILIDGAKADSAVMRNLERVLTVGNKKGARRKLLLASMMAVLQESRGKTSATNGVHVGLFQQSRAAGWPATREPERDSNAFFNKAIAADQRNPHYKLQDLVEAVQGSGHASYYAKWRNEAEDLVSHFLGGSASSSNSFTISRKKPFEFRVGKNENYWAAIVRLAEEVAWAVFTIRDTVYFISQEDLFKSKSRMNIREGEGGIDYIDYDDDDRRVTSTMTLTCRMKMWSAPLGSVVTVDDPGLPDSCQGRYLVTNLQRSYFSTSGSVTLAKPQHSKPEPAPEVVTKTITSGAGSDVSGSVTLKGSTRDKILEYARSTMTTKTGFRRYSKLGATTLDPTPEAPKRTDCSQWTRAIFHYVTGHDIGLNTWRQISNGRRTSHPKPGDLMFPAGGGHVEIYLGGGRTIGHGSPPIDYGKTSYWPNHFFVTFDFLDD